MKCLTLEYLKDLKGILSKIYSRSFMNFTLFGSVQKWRVGLSGRTKGPRARQGTKPGLECAQQLTKWWNMRSSESKKLKWLLRYLKHQGCEGISTKCSNIIPTLELISMTLLFEYFSQYCGNRQNVHEGSWRYLNCSSKAATTGLAVVAAGFSSKPWRDSVGHVRSPAPRWLKILKILTNYI